MINDFYYLTIPSQLLSEYKYCFTRSNHNSNFKFLQNFLRFIEKENSTFLNLTLNEDPTKDMAKYKYFHDINNSIQKFLLETAELPILDYKKKKLVRKAYYYIGTGYEHGIFNFTKNQKLAFINYKIAGTLGSKLGIYKIAQYYEKGEIIKKSDDHALCFYRCAAKLGLTDAMHTFGMIMIKGVFKIEKDEKMGISYLQHSVNSANSECPYSYFDMGMIFELGIVSELPKDEVYAFKLYLSGAKLGDSNSLYRVAQAYEKGELGTIENIKNSLKYYHLAAEKGHMDAILFLAYKYEEGISFYLKKSFVISFGWYHKAAIKFNHKALFKCGEAYENGLGVEKDIFLAYWYYVISNDAGNHQAKKKIYLIQENIINCLDNRNNQKCVFWKTFFCYK